MKPGEQTEDGESAAGSRPEGAESAAPRPRRLRRFLGRAFVVAFCAFCLCLGAASSYVSRSPTLKILVREWGKHPLSGLRQFLEARKTTGGGIKTLIDPLAPFKPELQLPAEKQHVVTLLLLGCDADYEVGRPVALKNTWGRSDAIMLARVDFKQKTLRLLSIPRDTAVTIPSYDTHIHKINAANSYGGPLLAQKTIKDSFGIDTDYYVSLDFEAFKKVVDAIDGVDLTVDKPLDYDDNWGHLHIHLKPGYQHLDGYRAMGYVRIRHSDDDLHRAERQHAFVEALRSKVTRRETFLKLPDAINGLTENIHTNLTLPQLLTFANFARTLSKEQIQATTLPSIEGRSFVYANVPESRKLIGAMFFDGDIESVSMHAPVQIASRRRSIGAHGVRTHHRKRSRQAAPAAGPTVPADGQEAAPDPQNAPEPGAEAKDTEGMGVVRT